MYKIKDLKKEDISNWSTSELTENFNMTMKQHNKMSTYLSSDEVRYCDAINTWKEIEEIEEQHKRNNYNLSDIHDEVISRINNTAKRVYLFGDDKVFTSYVLPKCHNEDSLAFIICKSSELNALHNKNYNMYLSKDIERLNYKIDRKEDNSINWHISFPKYDRLTPYYDNNDGIYYIAKYNDKYGFVDENGLDITPIKYDYVCKFNFNLNLAKVEINSKWGVVDYDGNELVECKYDDIILPKYFISSENKRIIVRIKNEFGVINEKGQTVIPIEYESVEFFENNLLLITNNNKDMLFDFNGKNITKMEYDRINYFNKDLIQVKLNGYSGFINPLGEEITPTIYYWIDEIKHGLAMVENETGYGFLDEKGDVVIPCIYSSVRVFDNELIKVSLNGKLGLIDRKGNIVATIQYDSIKYFNSEVIKVIKDNREYFIDRKGVEVIEPKDNSFTRDFLGEKFESWKYTGI